jgi:uncharacterized protein YoxC
MGIDMFTDKFTKVVNGLLTLVGIGNSSFTYAGGRETVVAGADVTAKLGVGLEATAGADTKIGAQHTFISGSLLKGNSVENKIGALSNELNTTQNTLNTTQNTVTGLQQQVTTLGQQVTTLEQRVTQERMSSIVNDVNVLGRSVRLLGNCMETIATKTQTLGFETSTVASRYNANHTYIVGSTVRSDLSDIHTLTNGMTVIT